MAYGILCDKLTYRPFMNSFRSGNGHYFRKAVISSIGANKKSSGGGDYRIKTSKTNLVYVLLSFSDKHLNWSFISATFFSNKKEKTYFLLDCYIDDRLHPLCLSVTFFRAVGKFFSRDFFLFVFEVSEEDILLC